MVPCGLRLFVWAWEHQGRHTAALLGVVPATTVHTAQCSHTVSVWVFGASGRRLP